MTRVAVIVPCFNAGRFLGEAIQSALGQSPRPHEVIVIDDGSTDDSVAVARSFGDPVRILHQKQAGPASARNAGIRAAESDLVALLDADDVWLPGKLDVQLPRFDAPDVGLVYGRMMNFVDGQPPSGEPRPTTLVEGHAFEKVYFRNFIPHSTVIARREAILGVGGYDETLPSAHDFDLWLRLSQRWQIRAVPQVVTLYRRHAQQIGSRKAAEQMANSYRAQEKAAEALEARLGMKADERRAKILAQMVEDVETRYWLREIRNAGAMARTVEKIMPHIDPTSRRRLRAIRRRSLMPEWIFRLRDRIG